MFWDYLTFRIWYNIFSSWWHCYFLTVLISCYFDFYTKSCNAMKKKIRYYAHYFADKTRPKPKVLLNSNFVSEPSLTEDFSTFLVFYWFSVNFMPYQILQKDKLYVVYLFKIAKIEQAKAVFNVHMFPEHMWKFFTNFNICTFR